MEFSASVLLLGSNPPHTAMNYVWSMTNAQAKLQVCFRDTQLLLKPICNQQTQTQTHTQRHTHRITNMEGGYYPLPVRCCPGQRTTRTKYLYRLSFGGSNGSDCKLWAQMAWACNGITLACQVHSVFGAGYNFNRTMAVEQAIGGSSPRASKNVDAQLVA